ncbi:MAG: hypothetical protein PHQ01_03795 [Candidatus Pacebacteria bacterium]|nr:hypothetical protein [Candidatus Paceibacterota bacterium]
MPSQFEVLEVGSSINSVSNFDWSFLVYEISVDSFLLELKNENCTIEEGVKEFIENENLIIPIRSVVGKILDQFGKDQKINIFIVEDENENSIFLEIVGIGKKTSYIVDLKKFNEWFIPNIYRDYQLISVI